MKVTAQVLAGSVALVAVAALGVNAALLWSDPLHKYHSVQPPRQRPVALSSGPVQFVDITARAGIRFKHNNGAFGLKLFPENMGSGCGFVDFDSDGWPDIVLINSRDWTPEEVRKYLQGSGAAHRKQYNFVAPAAPARGGGTCALFRNNRDGTFSDVTRGSGLDIEMYGLGLAIGDYDNDGQSDLYITGYGRNYLFHNQTAQSRAKSGSKYLGARPVFREVAQAAGVRDAGLSTSAAWLDYDRDGLLDLFVCHYSDWEPESDAWHSLDNKTKSYSAPTSYQGQECRLYRNAGGGRFVDVSARSGINQQQTPGGPPRPLRSKSLGVAVYDYDNDGWPDIAVANDNEPNFLFRNNRNGTFKEVAVKAGIVYGISPIPRSGMGIDTADIDHSGRDSIVIGNYSQQMLSLFHNAGQGTFTDMASLSGIASPSHSFLTFGCLFFDANNDGWPDLMTANGHVLDDIHKSRPDTTYAQRPQLFLNKGRPTGSRGSTRSRQAPVLFEEIGLRAGQAMSQEVVGRGLACADVNLDGRADVLLTSNGDAPLLLLNQPAPAASAPNHTLRITLQGAVTSGSSARGQSRKRASNRDGIGATVQVWTVGKSGQRLRRQVRSGSSYLSQSELPLTIGLGTATKASRIQIKWPSGASTDLRDIPADRQLFIHETKGLLRLQPLPGRGTSSSPAR